MFKKLTPAEAEERGIYFAAKVDDATGEQRARLTACDVDVTITQASEGGGGWQRSHRHARVVEIATILKGQVIAVEKTAAGALFFRQYGESESFETHPDLSHNLFVRGGSVLSTIKLYDDPDARDWIADPELDAETCHMSWEEALSRALRR